MLLSLESISLLAALLQLQGELIEVLLEVGGTLHHDLQCWVRSSLDPDDCDVSPSGEYVHHLCQLSHALISEAEKLERFMLALVEHILDDAHILVRGESGTDRDNIAEVLFTIAWLAFLPLPLTSVIRSLLAGSGLVLGLGGAVLAATSAVPSPASWLSLLGVIGLGTGCLVGGLDRILLGCLSFGSLHLGVEISNND